jgi:formyltetrahydrofolate deformylase
MRSAPATTHILTLACPDRPGIVASVAQGLFELGSNILENAQFSDTASGMFCMRTRFEAPEQEAEALARALAGRAAELGGSLRIRREDDLPRVLLMVSKYDHCLVDLLQRWRAGELPAAIPLVVSNHPDLEELVRGFGVDFVHLGVTPAGKAQAEAALLELVRRHGIDLVVLARYMQILSDGLCAELAGRAINIHHSFLPGFKGARPYHQAWDRGVKIIGATAHYVTAELDEGPIIDQDVVRVSHADTPERMAVAGKDVERLVLSRAVKAHVEWRVFLLGHRTIVFW